MSVTREAVETALCQYLDPHLNQDPVSAGCVRDIAIQDGQVSVRLELGYAAGLFKDGWAQLLEAGLRNLDGVREARVQVDCTIAPHQALRRQERIERGSCRRECGCIQDAADRSRVAGAA